MIIIDTNIMSEIMRPKPTLNVVQWLNDADDTLYLTAISIAEICYGLRILPTGKRRSREQSSSGVF